MACGNSAGQATRAEAAVRRVGVLADGAAALVRVPGKIASLSTTAMERRGPAARAVAAASFAGGEVELLGGGVEVKIVKPPSLLATMSGTDGGEVRYRPAVIEVSGESFETVRLDTAGDNVELLLEDDEPAPERRAAGDDAGGSITRPPSSGSDPDNGDGTGPSAGLPGIGALGSSAPLPLPGIPGVPLLPERRTEGVPAGGPGTTVRVSLGEVRQAVSGHVIAARATAMTIAITKGPDTGRYGDSVPTRSSVVLDLDMGLLEVAAAAPEPTRRAVTPAGGAAESLPITGAQGDAVAPAGVVLLITGAVALIFGLRGRFFGLRSRFRR